MTEGEKENTRVPAAEVVIPDGTQFVIVDIDTKNELVQVEFSLNSRVVRAWVPASQFEQIVRN